MINLKLLLILHILAVISNEGCTFLNWVHQKSKKCCSSPGNILERICYSTTSVVLVYDGQPLDFVTFGTIICQAWVSNLKVSLFSFLFTLLDSCIHCLNRCLNIPGFLRHCTSLLGLRLVRQMILTKDWINLSKVFVLFSVIGLFRRQRGQQWI